MASRQLIQGLAVELGKPQGILIARAVIAEQLQTAIKSGNVAEITRLAKLNELANVEDKPEKVKEETDRGNGTKSGDRQSGYAEEVKACESRKEKRYMSEAETPEQKQPENEQKTGTDADQKSETQDGGDSNTPPEQ